MILAVLPINSFSIENEFQRPYGTVRQGLSDPGTAASIVLDSAFVYGTSGDSVGTRFSAPNAQTSGNFTFYAYCTGGAGTPDLVSADVYRGAQGAGDDDQPEAGGSPVCSSGSVDASGCVATPAWLTFSFTGCTFVESDTYWVAITNDEAAPATDSVNIQNRAGHEVDTTVTQNSFSGWSTTNGITTDPTLAAGIAPMVIKDDTGTIIGNPHISVTGHANDGNMRGNRYNYAADMSVMGVYWNAVTTDTDFKYVRIYQGSTLLKDITIDNNQRGTTLYVSFPPITFHAGIDYDVVLAGSGGLFALGNSYCSGNSPPADVLTSVDAITYVNGTAGSLTESVDCMFSVGIVVSNVVPKKNSSGAVGISY